MSHLFSCYVHIDVLVYFFYFFFIFGQIVLLSDNSSGSPPQYCECLTVEIKCFVYALYASYLQTSKLYYFFSFCMTSNFVL